MKDKVKKRERIAEEIRNSILLQNKVNKLEEDFTSLMESVRYLEGQVKILNKERMDRWRKDYWKYGM